MLTLSNVLSLSRAAFALAFLQDSVLIRLLAICLAMVSDFLDGYFARRQNTASHFGAILDPIMDKFFVFFAGGIFYIEKKLHVGEFAALLSRDLAICFFGLFLSCVRGWKGYECRAIWWGKVTTLAQFTALMALTINMRVPTTLYILFLLMAGAAFFELLARYRRACNTRSSR